MFLIYTARCVPAALTLVVFCCSVAGAQSVATSPPSLSPAHAPSPSPSPSALPEIGRVTTSDRRPESAGQSSRVTFVVDRSQIDAEGARTLADALTGVPGIELFPYGSFGAEVDFGIRGAASARTLVLVDGQPIGDPTTGTADLNQFSTIGVQRIEIVESGSSSLYGTSASGGVINVITSVPQGSYLEGSLGSYADRDVRIGTGNGVVGATFERHVATNNFAYPEFAYGPPACATIAGTPCNYPAGVRRNDYGDQSTGRLSLELPLRDGFSVRGRVDATALGIGVPSRLDGLTPDTTNRSANRTALIEIVRKTSSGTLSYSTR